MSSNQITEKAERFYPGTQPTDQDAPTWTPNVPQGPGPKSWCPQSKVGPASGEQQVQR